MIVMKSINMDMITANACTVFIMMPVSIYAQSDKM